MNPSIRPEFHTCTGRMEQFIRIARTALGYDEELKDIRERLVRHGAEAGESFHATTAAVLLGPLR